MANIMFILVCLDDCLEATHSRTKHTKYKYWVIDNGLTLINDGTCKATSLLDKWRTSYAIVRADKSLY
ncbi:gp008 [Erwinia phage vB_EamP-S6]|uniref:Gp008 n=1 Tax=Erwinia phage vB_EamP-S6 TaxID=1051675 RepID=G0YQA0_9CAUD|nr:gp008 [Erwinia phage vB_EamP-S6]AEJ81527.1 gp008 [Erwinia phage vB_EamP-S6]